MEIHHTKHHQTYIDKLNIALEKHPTLINKDVKELLKNLNLIPEEIRTAVRNHGGGHFNHSLFWQMITPNKENKKFTGEIAKEIEKEFGSFEEFKKKFIESGMARFGSGWTWLILENKKLNITSTPNQDNPISEGKTPLLGIDLWEHAYYLKYQNKRQDYLDKIFEIINWTFVNELYKKKKSLLSNIFNFLLTHPKFFLNLIFS